MALSNDQSGVMRGILVGESVALAAVFGAMVYDRSAMPDDSAAGTRLAFALRADIVIALWLGLSAGTLARHNVVDCIVLVDAGLRKSLVTAR